MPFGAPLYTVPKSGCRLRRPHDAMSVDDFGSAGDALMSVFHGLSAGNGRRPLRDGGLVDVPPPDVFFGSGSDGTDEFAESLFALQPESRALAATARTRSFCMTIGLLKG